MKVSVMRACLNSYNGGLVRKFKPEPHIQALTSFDKTINLKEGEDRELSLKEHCMLIEIISAKKNRGSNKESSKCFAQLTAELGGKSVLLALEHLHTNKQLKEAYVEAVLDFAADRLNHKYLYDLSQFIVLLSENLPFAENSLPAILKNLQINTLADKYDYFEKLIQEKLLHKYVILFILNTEVTFVAAEIIFLLAKYDLLKESNIDALPKADLGIMNSVLSLLEQTNLALLTQENLSSICFLSNNISNFYDIIDYLAKLKHLNQNVLDKLLNHSVALSSGQVVNLIEIFKNVSKISSSLAGYLDVILANAVQSKNIQIATDKLRALDLPLPIAQKVLDALFAHPQFHVNLLAGISLLVNKCLAALNSEHLQRILDQPEYAETLAAAIVTIKSMNTENQEMIDLIFQIPSHAGAIANAFQILVESDMYNAMTAKSIVNEHENSEKMTSILKLLGKNSICNYDNVLHFHEKKITCQDAENLMSLLDSKGLLNQPNFDRLLNYARFIKTIASAVACLANGEKLTQESFGKLLADPPHALKIAGKLGGKAYPKEAAPKVINKNDLLAVQEKAMIIARGLKQHAFFPEKSKGEITIFNQALARSEQLKAGGEKKPLRKNEKPNKDLFQIEKETLWKIFKSESQCEDESIDASVEDALFEDTFSAAFSHKPLPIKK